jgi:hypothetical protein
MNGIMTAPRLFGLMIPDYTTARWPERGIPAGEYFVRYGVTPMARNRRTHMYLGVVLLTIALSGFTASEAPGSGVPGDTFLFPCAMTRYSAPLKLGWVLGLSWNRPQGAWGALGPVVQLEPGFGGGKINIGYRYCRYHFLPVMGAGLYASLMRTWGDPLGDVQPGQTYAGLETTLSLAILHFNAGVFRHVEGDDGEHTWIATLGLAAGF